MKAPILLIHGGLCTIDACFVDLIEKLASTPRIIAYEYQGHGHPANIDRPLRFDLLADDASKLLKVLNIQRADVLGFSDGAGVAFQLARTHPEQVKSLITMSLIHHSGRGIHPSYRRHEDFGCKQAETEKQTPTYDAYRKVAPKTRAVRPTLPKVSEMTDGFQDVPMDEVRA